MLRIPAFYPKENLDEYLVLQKMSKIIWYEPPTDKELSKALDASIGTDAPIAVSSNYKPIFEYPNHIDNLFLYRKLVDPGDYRGLFDPLDLFNLLYQQLKIILQNVNEDPQLILNHLARLNLTKRKRHFFLYSLYYIINGLNGSPIDDEYLPSGIRPCLHKKLATIHLEIFYQYRSTEKGLKLDTGSEIFNNSRTESNQGFLAEADRGKPLTMKKIALIYIYKGIVITRVTAPDIARDNGFFSPNSGEKLYHEYVKYSSNAFRKAIESKTKGNNKIRLIEEILQHLEGSAREEAEKQINDLKRRIKEDLY